MFIKKDLRKIGTILAEDEDTNVKELRLQRRKAEFQGSLRVLCTPDHLPALANLQSLSVYDCQISDLAGIGKLTSLETLNLGRNPISHIPEDMAQLTSLQELWLDDCQLAGPLPAPITELVSLRQLRASNNALTELPDAIGNLVSLEILCLDRNQLTHLPESLTDLHALRKLMLRHNQLRTLPEGVPGATHMSLQLLHLSSNRLERLPQSLADCLSLTHVYLNANALREIPPALLPTAAAGGTRNHMLLPNLQHVNLAHNQIRAVPDPDTTSQGKDADVTILLEGNHQPTAVLA